LCVVFGAGGVVIFLFVVRATWISFSKKAAAPKLAAKRAKARKQPLP
jgi:hypothetical protein